MATAPIPSNDTSESLANLELEADLLGWLMCDNSQVDRVADIVGPNDFSEPVCARLFETIVHLVSQGKPANPATLRGYFHDDPALAELGGPAFLAQLTGNLQVHLTGPLAAPDLANLARRRRMREGLLNAARYCADLRVETGDIVELADAAVASETQSSIRQSTAAQCLSELIDGLDAEHHGVLCHHIPTLDELHGPMEPSQLIILAARPGMGKTAVALSYSIGSAASGHGVLFASLEMNGQQLAGRMAADLCFDGQAIPYAAIRDRKLNDFQRRRLSEAWSKLQGLPLNIIDAGALTPGRLAMMARRNARRMEANGHKLELIVVDYLQLMRTDSGTNKPYEAASEISKALKALAKEMNVPVLALAQLSREVEKRPDKRPQLSDLRDSGQIEQDADSVLFLLRNEYYLRLAEPDPMDPKRAVWSAELERHEGLIEFILAKRRNGVTGSAIGQFHGAYQAVR